MEYLYKLTQASYLKIKGSFKKSVKHFSNCFKIILETVDRHRREIVFFTILEVDLQHSQ